MKLYYPLTVLTLSATLMACGEKSESSNNSNNDTKKKEPTDTVKVDSLDSPALEITLYNLEDYYASLELLDKQNLSAMSSALDSAKLLVSNYPEDTKAALESFKGFAASMEKHYKPENDNNISTIWNRLINFKPEEGDQTKIEQYATENGFELHFAEGEYSLFSNPSYGMTVFASALDADENAYNAILTAEAEKRYAEDGGLSISMTELAERASACESFVKTYTESKYQEDVADLFQYYMYALLTGLDNTAVCDGSGLKPEAKAEWEKIAANNTNTEIGILLRNLMENIEENGGKCDNTFVLEALNGSSIGGGQS